MTARRRSLFYLEKLRIFHAVVTILLTLALLSWAIVLWQQGTATTGDVVLACTLAISVLSAVELAQLRRPSSITSEGARPARRAAYCPL